MKRFSFVAYCGHMFLDLILIGYVEIGYDVITLILFMASTGFGLSN